eukprot:6977575-Prymnesium_polylepis.2
MPTARGQATGRRSRPLDRRGGWSLWDDGRARGLCARAVVAFRAVRTLGAGAPRGDRRDTRPMARPWMRPVAHRYVSASTTWCNFCAPLATVRR